MSDAELKDLAWAAGLQVEWRDASGLHRTVAPDSLHAVLTSMGLDASSEAAIVDSRARLAHLQTLGRQRFLSTTVGSPVGVAGLRGAQARLVGEDGVAHDLPIHGDGDWAAIHAPQRPGYYRLDDDDRVLAVAPLRAWTVSDAAPGRRLWGAAAQVYSLRGEREAPFGDFGALADMASALGRRGADALAVSPVHALFAADPKRYGPYAPSTRLFLNVLFADPAQIDPAAPSLGRGSDLIDWPTDGAAKLAALRALHGRFLASGASTDRAALDAFRVEGGRDLENHARFEALHAHFSPQTNGGGWRSWPTEFHDVSGPAVEAFAASHRAEVDFHLFLQWLADRSLAAAQASARTAGMAIGLIADLAVGMDEGGSHAWSRPADLLPGLSVGAPPDIFQPTGQDWGLAAFSPLALRLTRFDAFIATLRTAMRHAGGVRIDHAIGLRRLWLTPHGMSADRGVFLDYPLRELMHLIALESWRHRAIVVGEDLGTVPEGFREETTAQGMLGMRVLWFERESDERFIPPDRWSREAMAMTSTHDLPTVAGWWSGRDIDWLERLNRRSRHADPAAERASRQQDRGRLWRACLEAGVAEGEEPAPSNAQEVVDAAVALVGRSGCDLAVIPLEDLLGHEEQPNHPGTTVEAPNWRRRVAADPRTELDAPAVAARIARLNAERGSRPSSSETLD